MKQRHISIATYAGSPRTKRFVLGSLGIVLTVTATSGMVLAGHDPKQTKSNVSKQNTQVEVHTDNQQTMHTADVSTSNVSQPPGQDDTPENTGTINTAPANTSPGAGNTSNASTVVTVNGESIQVNGDGTFQRKYTSDDGTTHVNISVQNSSDSNKEDSME